MKEIQEIMLEMDNLIDKIAVDAIEKEEAICEDGQIGEITPQAIVNLDQPFCCMINVPAQFPALTDQRRITYDVSCLTTKVKAVCSGCEVKYEVRVVGCIPFIVNVGVNTSGKCEAGTTSNLNDALCCGGCVCIDKKICETCIEWLAFSKAASTSFTCSNVTVVNLNATPSGTCGVQVTGTFRISVDDNCCTL